MAEGAERQPTIEQNSTFSTKTKDGQEVEFEATLKIYIEPTGDVRIKAPGAETRDPGAKGPRGPEMQGRGGGREEPTDTTLDPTTETSENITPSENDKAEAPLPSEAVEDTNPDAAIGKTGKEEKKESPPQNNNSEIRMQNDKDLSRAFPKAPGDCPISQFIPDPCKAIDDLQKSFKSLITNFFGSQECCPQPHLKGDKCGTETSHQEEEKGNKGDANLMNEEEKYDV